MLAISAHSSRPQAEAWGPASHQVDRINDEASINGGALKRNGGTGSGAAVRKF